MNAKVNGTHKNTIEEFSKLDSETQELINAAIRARTFSYSPYSNFKVGAAIRLADGSISTGCNIENSSYSPSICAERTAASKAISEGHHEFKAIAVVAFQESSFTTPCGVCRQFLAEFTTKDVPVYIAKPAPCQVLVSSIGSLLPMQFVPVMPSSNQ